MLSSPAAGSPARSRLRCSAAPASRTVVIDPHPVYPPDFRCEKLDGPQMQTLGLTGLADAVLQRRPRTASAGWRASAAWSRSVRATSRASCTTPWSTPCGRRFRAKRRVHPAKVTDITTGPERQLVKTVGGAEISARLVGLATGLNMGVREKLGIEREVISPGHSISIGFDVECRATRAGFRSPALTYFAESPADRMAYITLFPIGATMRANLFGYRDLHDPWLKQFRDAPRETLYAMWPGLRPLMGDFTVPEFVQDPSGRSLCHQGLSPARRRAGRRRVRHVMPGGRHRRAQGAGRRRAALQRAHPALARDAGHGRGEDRRVLRRPGQAGLRCLFAPQRPIGLRSFSIDHVAALAWRCAGSSSWLHWGKGFAAEHRGAAACHRNAADDEAGHAPTLGAQHARRRSSAPRHRYFWMRETDHRSVVDAVGVLRRRHAEVLSSAYS